MYNITHDTITKTQTLNPKKGEKKSIKIDSLAKTREV